MRERRNHGEGKHRTVGRTEEEPEFKNRRVKNRTRSKLAKQARNRNRKRK